MTAGSGERERGAARGDLVLRLSDGRRLGYAELGDREGVPVVWCHGGLSSRLDATPGGDAASVLGIRLIAPDRPGVGSSDRQPGRTLLDWPADVAALADALAIERFAVVGWSLGGPFAAVCAYSLADRVTALGLVASCIPRDWDGMVEEINPLDRRFMRRSRSGGAAVRLAFWGMRLVAAHAPRAFTRASARGLSPLARAPLEGEGGRWFAAAVAEGLRNPRGVVDDYRVLDSPWGFDPRDIAVATHVWQGGDDRLVPPDWATRLATAIRRSTLTVLAGEGHFVAQARIGEILRAAASTPRG